MSAKALQLVLGDITDEDGDALVNAANESLLGGGGVDGAIHRVAGPALLEACKKIGGCPTGEARITQGYNLSVKHVIHTVGPIWRGGWDGEDELLASCYDKSLLLAKEHVVKKISFPSISTGAYRFPFERATQIALRCCDAFQKQHELPECIRFVCYSEHDFVRYQRIAEKEAIALDVVTGAS